MIKFFLLFFLLAFRISFAQEIFHPVEYVDPFIGTGGHGHTYPGATVPFGMVQLSPDTRLDGWDGCSGYHSSDSVIYGFTHTHLSGTGCLDYGDILFMPVTGPVEWDNKQYSSVFKHENEIAEPGFYQVLLDKYSIKAELTATKHAGMHRYSFPASENAGIMLDLVHRDKVLESSLRIVSDREIEGKRVSSEWADRQTVYFVAQFSKPFDSFILNNGTSDKQIDGRNIKARFNFKTKKNTKIIVRIGISAVSVEGARKNLESDIPGWDFDIVKDHAKDDWNRELGKIVVNGGSKEQKTVFYTALYHCMLAPNLYMDADKKYLGRDSLVHVAVGFDNYTVFSLWDTYRAEHPLFSIIDTKRTSDFINTFLVQYEQGGLLPVWELSANETFCMIGYHSVPVIADAFLKGIGSFDAEKALAAMKNSANKDHLGLDFYKKTGFIPAEQEGESVSKTLEYAYDDWCIAMMAKKMGKNDDYLNFIRRSQYYKNLYDPSTGFMRAKMYNTWVSPFDPSEVNFNYTEANSWQYSFGVPQDISGLISLSGGMKNFAAKLDALFSADTKTSGRDQADITGLIGQYAQGNEPSHHMAYLYDYCEEPWKTQMLIHNICKNFYTPFKDGLIGNEDCGQMSAWYVFSAMGFYPVTPGSGIYAIGTPLFPEVVINLENGKKFIIKANGADDEHFYIGSASLNGKKSGKSFISHEDIMKGGELVFTMKDTPEKSWGTGEGNFPVSKITDNLITPVPAFSGVSRTFNDSMKVIINNPEKDAVTYYTTDGSDPSITSKIYREPFTIDSVVTIKAMSVRQGCEPGFIISSDFIKLPENRSVKYATAYAPQYTAGGENGLVDFIRGTKNFRTGTWQGFEGVNADLTIDLGSEKMVSGVSVGFLQDQKSWIFMPLQVDFYFSKDGITFTEAGSVINDIPDNLEGVLLKEFSMNTNPGSIRYIRMVAVNRGICPPWHPGNGYKSWIFTDEITIR